MSPLRPLPRMAEGMSLHEPKSVMSSLSCRAWRSGVLRCEAFAQYYSLPRSH